MSYRIRVLSNKIIVSTRLAPSRTTERLFWDRTVGRCTSFEICMPPSLSTLLQACSQWRIPRKFTLVVSLSYSIVHVLCLIPSQIAFALLWPLKERLARNLASTHAISHSPARFAIVAVLKLLILSGCYLFRKRTGVVAYRSIATFEEGWSDARGGGLWRPTAWVPSILMFAVASSHAVFDYLVGGAAVLSLGLAV